MSSLRGLNLAAAIMHYVLALALGLYFSYLNNKYPNQPVQGVELSMRDHNLEFTETSQSATGQTVTTNNSDGTVTLCDASGSCVTPKWVSGETAAPSIQVIQNLIIGFFLITGSFHLGYYLTDTKDGEYTRVIANKNNFYRWIEYSITSTMMLYIIAFSSGVKDTNIYMMLFATNIAMISQGQIIEENVRDGKEWWVPMITSFLLLLAEFYIIARTFWSRLSQVNIFLKKKNNSPLTNGQTIPSWLNYMIIVLFLFYSCFGFVSLYGAYSGANYESIEKTYIILSFAAKAVLGVFVAFGLSQRQAPRKMN